MYTVTKKEQLLLSRYQFYPTCSVDSAGSHSKC